MDMLPDHETDSEFLARLDWMDAVLKARLEADYPVSDHHPESHHEPSPADWADYRQWSQSVEEHDEAMQTWLEFFGEDDCKSTYYVS